MKRMANWLVTALVVAGFLAAMNAAAMAQATGNPMWGEITGDRVNIRSGASTADRVVKSVDSGTAFIILGQKDNWVQLQAGADVECWIAAQLVRATGDSGVVTASGKINLRATGSTQYPPIGQIEGGATVRILETTGGWVRIAPPAGLSLYVDARYIRPVRPVSAEEFAAYVGGANVPNAGGTGAAAQPVNAAATSPSNAEIEQQVYAELVGRFDSAMADYKSRGLDESLIEGLESLAKEFDAFAAACQTASVASAARTQADTLRSTKSLIEDALVAREGAEEAKKRLEELRQKQEEEARKKAEEDAINAENSRREQILNRLLYAPADGYVARGQVSDARDANGRKVYILVENGEVLFRLELAPTAAHIDLRELWHRSVGIQGRVVKIDGEQYPVLVCTRIDAQN